MIVAVRESAFGIQSEHQRRAPSAGEPERDVPVLE